MKYYQINHYSRRRAGFMAVIISLLSSALFALVCNATGASAYSYHITFNSSLVSDMPSDVDTTTMDSSVNLPSTTPTREGYKFKNWCTTFPTGTGSNLDTCSGTIYAPSSTFTISDTSANNLTLYAMWEEDVDYLQNLDPSKCTSTISTAIDSRDGTEYHIQRLQDGKCWLLDNLAFNGKDNQGNGSYIQMDSSNTNIASGRTYTWNDTIRTGWTSSSQNSYTAAYINDASKDTVPQGSSDPLKAEALAGNWKVGVYYNFCAASAGTICVSSNSSNSTYDICPAGWRMPGGGSTVNLTVTPPTGEYQNLYNNNNYNTYANYRRALRLPLSGYFSSGSPYNQGSSGYFWSSTRLGNNGMYSLLLGTSSIVPADYNGRLLGFSVRCVLGS